MRYIIGIDLGTTNCCVAYVDTESTSLSIHPFRIPQLTAAGVVQAEAMLPSFCYLPANFEWALGTLALPWENEPKSIIGVFAKEYGAKVPTRLVRSAKSWLCHAAANRREKILPFELSDESIRISPVEATTRYLHHIKSAWNHTIAKGDASQIFEEQEIVLTVPASFDEVARTLTAEAAKQAGFGKMTLLEEPQAAFYNWISSKESQWQEILNPGTTVLVCDVGGGTTDFSLMEVSEKEGKRIIQRMAVGDHLLIGGDNMDAALAHFVEKKLQSQGNHTEFTSNQWLQLCHEVRSAKEKLLQPNALEKSYKILLQGTGSSVIQGTVSIDLFRDEVESLLLQGFFSQYEWQDALHIQKARGLRTMGLPYEDDPSITKHLAHFLKQSGKNQPDYIFFNGGAMKSPLFQEAIIASLRRWFPAKHVQVLVSPNLDLSVARGAAYYGKARRGIGVRIGGGAARGYYLTLNVKNSLGEISKKAITLLPRGSEEGTIYEPNETFWITPNSPVAFQLLTSHIRLDDKQGELVDIEPQEMQSLPPIHTLLRFGKKQIQDNATPKIPVHIRIGLTEIGTLELWLISQKTDHKWSLEFQVRNVSGQEDSLASLEKPRTDETFDIEELQPAMQAIRHFFAQQVAIPPEKLMEHLEKLLDRPRREWSLSVLRSLWVPLIESAARRKCSAEHELRWWNLAGFFLRPGFGYSLDDFRMKEMWKVILSESKNVKSSDILIQQWICFRRIAGGLNKGQQNQLATDLLPTIVSKQSGKIEVKGKSELYQYSEKIRALGALELIDVNLKIKLGQAIIERIARGDAAAAEFWTLGRIGARHLVYGTAANVIPRETCSLWVETLIKLPSKISDDRLFALGQLARKSDHRELNLSEKLVQQVLDTYSYNQDSDINTLQVDRLRQLLSQEGSLNQSEQEKVFGDKLPAGLTLEN